MANRLARIRAETTLRIPYWPRATTFFFAVVLALNAWALGNSSGPVAWGNVFGVLACILLVCVLPPLLAEERGRAKAFLLASEDPQGAPHDAP